MKRFEVTLLKSVAMLIEADSIEEAGGQAIAELEDFEPDCQWEVERIWEVNE